MKKRNKFILPLVLGAGVIATFGASYALYQSKTNAADFSIGIGSVQSYTDSDKNVTYKIGTVNSYKYAEGEWATWGDDKLNPTYSKVKVNVPLSFEYDKGVVAQSSVVGRFTVEVTLNDKIPLGSDGSNNTLSVGVSAKLVGYDTKAYEATNAEANTTSSYSTYFTQNKMHDFFNTTFNSSENRSAEHYIDTAVDKDNISCDIELDFSNSIKDSNFYDISELASAFSISLKWECYKSTLDTFDSVLKPDAFIVGDANGWTYLKDEKELNDYRMVPNLYGKSTDKVEWMYENLTGFGAIKVRDLSSTVSFSGGNETTWIGCRGGAMDSIDSDYNAKLNADNSYSIYNVRNGTTADVDKGFWVVKNS